MNTDTSLLAETLQSFSEAAKKIPAYRGTAEHADPSTVFRWANRGCRAADGSLVKLQVVRVGGRYLTSVEAIQRFFESLNTDAVLPKARPRSATKRRRASQRASDELKAAGV